MSLINSTLQTTVLRLRDLTGNITAQKIHNRIFDAYEAKSLVLEMLTPDQQRILHACNGAIPTGHAVGQPMVIDTWADLMQVHTQHNLYQLLPRRAKSNAAYQVMRAVCCSPGSPFIMDQRYDPLELKFMFRQADQEVKQAFNNKSAEKVGSVIWFDGVLRNDTDTGLVMAHPAISPASINGLVGMVTFLREWSNEPSDGDRHRQMKAAWKEVLAKRTHMFCGSGNVPAKDLVTFARNKGVHLYVRRGTQYVYQP